MKLKKIASLMLAGIMAVSMLAGCNGEPAPGPDDDNNGGVTVTGYSAVLGEALKDHEAIKDKDYITFANNNEDQAALQAAVDNVETGALKTYANIKGVKSIGGGAKGQTDIAGPTGAQVEEVFVKAAKITDPSKDLKPGDLAMAWYAGYNNDATNKYTGDLNTSVKDGAIFVVNGGVTTNEAVKMVAAKVDEILDGKNALPEYNEEAVGVSGESWKYSYVISVSVVDKAQHSNYTEAANSAHFIAVTVTRTATNA